MTLLGWLYWLAYQVLSLVFLLLGIPVVGLLAATRSWKRRPSRSPMFPGLTWAWRFEPLTFPFGNEEDGIGGNKQTAPTPIAAFKWSALRNSANNLRLLPGISYVLPDKPTVHRMGPATIITSGWRQCVYVGGFHFGWLMAADWGKGWRSWPVIAHN